MSLFSNIISRSFVKLSNPNVIQKANWNLILKSSFSSAKPAISEKDGASETQDVNPLSVEDFFGLHKLVTVKDLFEARVHLGHKEGSLNEHMKRYLYGSRLGHLIIDLDKTVVLLRKALTVTAHIAYRDGIVLMISQQPQNAYLIEQTALEAGEFAHTRRWRRGMFTNSTMMYKAMTRLPDLCIVFNTLTTVLEQHWCITEAAKMSIPTVGIVDTNCNPNLITYPVPGNDDTPSAINLYCHLFKTAILVGKEARKKNLESKDVVTP